MYLLRFIWTVFKLIFIARTQLKKAETACIEYLRQLENTYDGSFDAALIKKVAKFQSIQLYFVANAFSGLFHRKNNAQEALKNTQYFLMTVLYDELIDEYKMNEKRLNELFYHPETANSQNFKERVLIAMHRILLDEVRDKNNYWDTIEKVHIAQKDSVKQFDKNTSVTDITDITIRKGGYSLLMCRHYLKDPIYAEIDQCWFLLGGLIQMTNDLYDTYKDTQAGIRTFANQATDINQLEAVYDAQKHAFKQSIINLPFDTITKQNFCLYISLIPAFGDIAIHQLKGLSSNSHSLPNFKEIPRKSLIIDMEKASNKYRLIKYAYKNGKLWM